MLVRFPFSDLSQAKLRPALALAYAGRTDWVLCQITSRPYADPLAVQITNDDFAEGSLRVVSYARPGKLFTASDALFEAVIGNLRPASRDRAIGAVIDLLRVGSGAAGTR